MQNADLRGANLQEVVFNPNWHGFQDVGYPRYSSSRTHFKGANLRGADLRGADRVGIDLGEAIVEGALF